ncbi:MAG: site-2 protease family protein [Ktedonobacteraceae bacterium]
MSQNTPESTPTTALNTPALPVLATLEVPVGQQPSARWRAVSLHILPWASALVSLIALVLVLRSWKMAIGLLLLIFVHELGHMIALRLRHIPARGPFFVPLLGAFVTMGRMRKGEDIALVALAGPFLGGVGALFCYAMAWYSSFHDCGQSVFRGIDALHPSLCFVFGQGPFWLTLALVGFIFNLANLLPLNPLDGGRVVAVISRWLWLPGILLSLSSLFVLKTFSNLSSPIAIILDLITLLMIISGVSLTIYSFLKPAIFQGDPLPPSRRILIAAIYIGLAASLAGGWLITSHLLAIIRESFMILH